MCFLPKQRSNIIFWFMKLLHFWPLPDNTQHILHALLAIPFRFGNELIIKITNVLMHER